jgi:hypothetical protein
MGAARRWTASAIAHPIVRDERRRTVLRDAYVMRWNLGFDGEIWADPARGLAILPALRGESRADWLLVDRSGTSRGIHLPPFGDAFAVGWSPSAESFAWKWYPWPSRTASKSRRSAPMRVALLDRDLSLRNLEVTGTSSYDTQVAWLADRTLFVTEYEPESPRGWWITIDAETGTLGDRNELPAGLGLAAPALQQQWGGGRGRAYRLPYLDAEPVALLTDRAALNLWYRAEGAVTPPRLVRLDVEEQTLSIGQELPELTLAATLGNLEDGSLVWASPERAPRLPHWDGGSRSRIFRLRSFDGPPEVVCEVASGRLFRYLGQHRDWLVWSTPEFRYEYELWGCNPTTGESRRLSEWEEWANPTVAIGDGGIFTPRGWVPLASGGG